MPNSSRWARSEFPPRSNPPRGGGAAASSTRSQPGRIETREDFADTRQFAVVAAHPRLHLSAAIIQDESRLIDVDEPQGRHLGLQFLQPFQAIAEVHAFPFPESCCSNACSRASSSTFSRNLT